MRTVPHGVYDPWQWLERQLEHERRTTPTPLQSLSRRLYDACPVGHQTPGKYWRTNYGGVQGQRLFGIRSAGWEITKMFAKLRRKLTRLTRRLRDAGGKSVSSANGVQAERRWREQRLAFWNNLLPTADVVQRQCARERALRAQQMYCEGLTRVEIAARMEISVAAVTRMLDRYNQEWHRQHSSPAQKYFAALATPTPPLATGDRAIRMHRALCGFIVQRDWLLVSL